MFTVSVRDHVMIAHSFEGELFGPAQRLHGATYVVDVELRGQTLSDSGVVVDIGRASNALKAIMSELNYRNLDEIPAFAGKNTTTEFMAKVIFDRFLARMNSGDVGSEAKGVESMKVTLGESHIASASYEGATST